MDTILQSDIHYRDQLAILFDHRLQAKLKHPVLLCEFHLHLASNRDQGQLEAMHENESNWKFHFWRNNPRIFFNAEPKNLEHTIPSSDSSLTFDLIVSASRCNSRLKAVLSGLAWIPPPARIIGRLALNSSRNYDFTLGCFRSTLTFTKWMFAIGKIWDCVWWRPQVVCSISQIHFQSNNTNCRFSIVKCMLKS